jgi:GAF domain-containing protein
VSELNAREICRGLSELEARDAGLAEILERSVELLHESSSRFDWTGIYELHPDGTLRLGPFVGEPTEHVSITVGQGVCGSAIANKCNMNIPDVSKVTNYLACSTATSSELVVLIRKDDRIYAQIDIDSHQLDAFSEDLVEEVERLADWLAGAYERHAMPVVGPAI